MTAATLSPLAALLGWRAPAAQVRPSPLRPQRGAPVLLGDIHMRGPSGRPAILDLCPPPPLDPARAGLSRRR